MIFYAQLNENSICIGLSQLSGEVKQENMVEIETFDNDILWRKFDGKRWSAEKFEPESTAPISDFEAMQVENKALKTELASTKKVASEMGKSQEDLINYLIEVGVIA